MRVVSYVLESHLMCETWKDWARELHKKLCEQRGVTTTFTASDGWLWRFGQLHGIRQLNLQGEKLSANRPAAENFIASFEHYYYRKWRVHVESNS